MNIDSSVTGKAFWGRSMWGTIHLFASTAKSARRIELFEKWMATLARIMPCQDVCGVNLRENLRALPLQGSIETGLTALEWTYRLHDKVNRDHEKASPTYSNVRDFYDANHRIKYGSYSEYFWHTMYSIASFASMNDMRADLVQFLIITTALIPNKDHQTGWRAFFNNYEIQLYLHNELDLFYYLYMLNVYIEKIQARAIPAYVTTRRLYERKFGLSCDTCAAT